MKLLRLMYLQIVQEEIEKRLSGWEIINSSNMTCDQILNHILIIISQSELVAEEVINSFDHLDLVRVCKRKEI